jgi:hypothetical protein
MASPSSRGGVWPVLLEKAVAKFYGTYENLVGGNTMEGMYLLTGRPVYDFATSKWSASTVYDKVAAWDRLGYTMTCSVSNPPSGSGLVGYHAYTLIGVAQYNGTKLYKIRNPHGNEKFVGPWSDVSG